MSTDAMLGRCWERAITDDLAVAVGESLQPELGRVALGDLLNHKFSVGWRKSNGTTFYRDWDAFISAAEAKAGRSAVQTCIAEVISAYPLTDLHRRIARLPISNFIDVTVGRSLTKALLEVGKQPLVHGDAMRLGEWEVADPDRPHVFHVHGDINSQWQTVRSLISDHADGHVENILDMLRRKDLLLIDFNAFEAEYVLRLSMWAVDTPRIVNCAPEERDFQYWARRGVYVSQVSPQAFLDGLLPAVGARYGSLDLLTPPEMMIDLARRKPHDCFISYSRVDHAYVSELERQLRHRGIRCWRDVSRMRPGNPLDKTVRTEIERAHALVVVLSPDAVSSDWVQRELEYASVLQQARDIEIVPIWYRDCRMPDSIANIHHIDVRGSEPIPAIAVDKLAAELRDITARAAKKLR